MKLYRLSLVLPLIIILEVNAYTKDINNTIFNKQENLSLWDFRNNQIEFIGKEKNPNKDVLVIKLSKVTKIDIKPDDSRIDTKKTKGHSRELKGFLGGFLTTCGILMAINGFQKIETSKPALDITNWTWSKIEALSWWVNSYGIVKNTGNVPLKNVRIYRTYYDASGNMIANDYCYLDVYWSQLPEGYQDSWSYTNGGWLTEPARVELRAEYEYDKTYKYKNDIQGTIGVIIACAGIYLIYDAFYSGTKLQQSLNNKDIDIKIVNNNTELFSGFLVCKRF